LVLGLPRANQAPDIARRWVAETFAAELDILQQQKARLLVSELVTNAVIHGRGRIELRARLDQDRLLVRVIDEGPGFTTALRERDLDTPGGDGLRIVDAEASRWGIREGAADVWFELRRQPLALTPR
jgi:anti-sigma regulatory factor (Ser/Thr protein kinase)